MRRPVALLIYVLALIGALNGIVQGMSHGWFEGAIGLVGALSLWWIATGFGVRLGVTPDDFAAWVKRLLGFGVEYDVPEAREPQVPS